MMKKILALLLCLLFALSFAACGSDNGEAEKDTADATAAESTSPYNWLGYPDIPQCNYLDCVAAQHYYREYTSYILLSSGAEGVVYCDALDGKNTYQYCESSGSLTYTIDGMAYFINESSKSYQVKDFTEAYAAAPSVTEQAAANKNETDKVFQSSGTAVIPIYDSIDNAEYEYYEYVSGSGDMMLTERFYMKDGDVFVIYTKVGQEESTSEYTNIITKMTGDIPAGLFDLPDLGGYEMQS